MTNMLLEEIDVTNWVENKNYRPHYCDGRIDKLLNPQPHIINNDEQKLLFQKANEWYRNEKFKNISQILKTEYSYSYFISNVPIDVYQIKIAIDSLNDSLYIQYDGKHFMNNISEDSWVINDCQ